MAIDAVDRRIDGRRVDRKVSISDIMKVIIVQNLKVWYQFYIYIKVYGIFI